MKHTDPTLHSEPVGMSFTPGPWRANSSWIEGPKMALRVACVDWPRSGRGIAPRTDDEAKANARLIAAAPDLLAALQPFLNATLTSDGRIIGLMREDFDRARAAIAKALGSDQ